MTAVDTAASPADLEPDRRRSGDRPVTLAELLTLAAGLTLALVTIAALGTALLEAHSVATVAACTGAGLLLAGAFTLLRPTRVVLAPRDLLFAAARDHARRLLEAPPART